MVGLLSAALYKPVWTSAILNWPDVAPAVVAFALLEFRKAPSWLVVLLTAVAASLGWA